MDREQSDHRTGSGRGRRAVGVVCRPYCYLPSLPPTLRLQAYSTGIWTCGRVSGESPALSPARTGSASSGLASCLLACRRCRAYAHEAGCACAGQSAFAFTYPRLPPPSQSETRCSSAPSNFRRIVQDCTTAGLDHSACDSGLYTHRRHPTPTGPTIAAEPEKRVQLRVDP
jgi:hypothetical protein